VSAIFPVFGLEPVRDGFCLTRLQIMRFFSPVQGAICFPPPVSGSPCPRFYDVGKRISCCPTLLLFPLTPRKKIKALPFISLPPFCQLSRMLYDTHTLIPRVAVERPAVPPLVSSSPFLQCTEPDTLWAQKIGILPLTPRLLTTAF